MPPSAHLPPTLRSSIATLPVYRPGKPAPLTATTSYKLSSNENPFPPLPGVLEAAEIACAQMNRYPDLGNVAVTEAVASHLAVPPEQLAFGTGSVGVLYHLLQVLAAPGDEIVYAWRSFEAYPIATQVTGARSVQVPLGPGATHDLDAMLAAITPATKAVLLCTPNNPTGPSLRHDDVINFIAAVPEDIVVVIDEAYVEFVTDPEAVRAQDLLNDHANVVILRTFSKAYGLAGLRIGFCIAHPTIATAVRAASLPFGVSIPAQAAAIASLGAKEALLERVRHLVGERDQLADGLRRIGFDVPAAQGNFVWLEGGDRTMDFVDAFVAAGAMVRPYASGEPADGIRITVGDPAANALVLTVAETLNR